jgi:hypothetical protein
MPGVIALDRFQSAAVACRLPCSHGLERGDVARMLEGIANVLQSHHLVMLA